MSSAMTPGRVYDDHSGYRMRGAMASVDLIAALADQIDPDTRHGRRLHLEHLTMAPLSDSPDRAIPRGR